MEEFEKHFLELYIRFENEQIATARSDSDYDFQSFMYWLKTKHRTN